jgi:hypothetical protein
MCNAAFGIKPSDDNEPGQGSKALVLPARITAGRYPYLGHGFLENANSLDTPFPAIWDAKAASFHHAPRLILYEPP